MDPGVILSRGRTSALAGRHKEALRDFVWFHAHALEHDRAYHGVRLSFAIGYWRELADIYPPARDALDTLRERTEELLLRGGGGRLQFQEIVAIDREMGAIARTYRLYAQLAAERPEVAKQCADLAVEPVAQAGDFELASRFLPHPETYLLWLSERLNAVLSTKGVSGRATEGTVRNYCSDVRTLLKILKGLGNNVAAQAALEWAVALVENKAARAEVMKGLNE